MNESYFFFPPFRSAACVNAEAATALTAFDDFGSRKSLEAFDATFLEVCSFRFVAMANPFRKSLVSGTSEPNRSGLASLIGVDPQPTLSL